MSGLDGDIVFRKSSGIKRLEEDKLEVKQEYVTLQSKIGDVLMVNFKAPEKEIAIINEYFENLTDMEPMTMNIADSGDIECYFKGISPLKELDEEKGNIQLITVTVQELHE